MQSFRSINLLWCDCLVDCSSTSIAGAYLYTLPASAPLGTLMSVTCAAGYVWSSAPTNGVHNATCSNVSNSIQWAFSGSCVGALCVSVELNLQYHNSIIFRMRWRSGLQRRDALKSVRLRDGKTRPGPRAETGRAWKSRPAGLTGRTGLMLFFYLRFLCALCAGRWVVTRELCIVVTCKCVVYWANVHENEIITVCACNLWTRYD